MGEQESRDRLRAIIDSLADGIVIVDKTGEIRFANPAAARLFNRPADQLIGTPFGSPVVAGETTEMEIVRRGGGEVLYAELRVVDTEWDGSLVELVSLRDITDRRHAEERARQLTFEREARLEAEAASQAKSDFLAIMSHELRTPLNAILGYSELMELGISGSMTDGMRNQVGRIRVSAKHLLGLVNDILDLAKVEAGRLDIANAPASLFETITSAATLIQPQADARNHSLVVMQDLEKLPRYVGDEERVRQILVNLLANAIKSTEPGGRISVIARLEAAPKDRPRLQRRGNYIRIDVTDTGSGIPEDKLEAIFEPFVQADTGPTRSQEGTGLGLTIGRRLARLMGGDLEVESQVGKGSVFSLWLPSDEDAGDTEALEQSGDRHAVAADGGPSTGKQAGDRPVDGLCLVGNTMLERLEPTLSVIVARIRSDSGISMAAGLRSFQVADHLATFLADIAGALSIVEEAAGKPSPLLADAMEIQRLISERHGAQRAWLGWNELALRREFMIIREEVERVVRTTQLPDRRMSHDDAVATVSRFIDQAEYATIRALEKATRA